MRIGLVSGGFNPYHKGHHFMVEQASSENDKVIILTSPSKGRDCISGEDMARVWTEVIMPIFPLTNVELEFQRAPVGRVFKMLEELEAGTLDDDVILNLYAGAEEMEKRFSDINLSKRYPNSFSSGKIEKTPFIRGVDSPKASGEDSRKCLDMRNHKAFREMLPKFLKEKAGLIMQMLL